jgi:hypothetical protein
MHGELTERGKWCVQNNELPDESHVDELEDFFFQFLHSGTGAQQLATSRLWHEVIHHAQKC